MNYTYKKAELKDIDALVKTRIEVLRAANRLGNDTDMSLVEKNSRQYYEEALQSDMHRAYLVYDGEKIIGAGGISFFQVMPTYHNPTGWKAYIMNMYTESYGFVKMNDEMELPPVSSAKLFSNGQSQTAATLTS